MLINYSLIEIYLLYSTVGYLDSHKVLGLKVLIHRYQGIFRVITVVQNQKPDSG